MEEAPKYVLGIDIGSENIRAVMAMLTKDGPSVTGHDSSESSGVRKGEIVSLNGAVTALDRVLSNVERMSGHTATAAVVSINGVSVESLNISGNIIVGDKDHKIDSLDIDRLQKNCMADKDLNNRKILEVIPIEYKLDGQSGIREPYGMTGIRLELMSGSVVSALEANVNNIYKVVEDMSSVEIQRIIPSVMAAAQAVLTERQKEHGVAVIDLGAATTSVAVYDAGNLQCMFVVPIGAEMITKDLANILEIDMDLAETVKRRFVDCAEFLKLSAGTEQNAELEQKINKNIVIHKGSETIQVNKLEVNQKATERLLEIFEKVYSGLKYFGYDWRLPEGAVLVGGGANLKGVEKIAKEVMKIAIKIGTPKDLLGDSDPVSKPEYATAVGLMLSASEFEETHPTETSKSKKSSGNGLLAKLFKKF